MLACSAVPGPAHADVAPPPFATDAARDEPRDARVDAAPDDAPGAPYGVDAWSAGYLRVGDDGALRVRVAGAEVALADVVDHLEADGRPLPTILRFPQILEDRLARVHEAFEAAMATTAYRGGYQGVYPIKVNQRRVVVETLAGAGARWRTGLEAGSKAELALVLVQDTHPDALIQCNGFKDDDFVRLALWGRALGKHVVLTLEKVGELERILRVAEEMGVRPAIGVRFKLHARGSGTWASSGGDDAKFGLTAGEVAAVVARLEAAGMADALVMLHTHVGSQVPDVHAVRVAVREAAQVYAHLARGDAAPRYLNVGGGLAVDYDGSKTATPASANYGLSEYAEALVTTVAEVCDEAGVDHPCLVTESGRALTAHHAVVVAPVVDAIGPTRDPVDLPPLPDAPHPLVADMEALLADVGPDAYRRVYNEAVSNKATMHQLFDLGYLGLAERAHVERAYGRILSAIADVVADLDYAPEPFDELPDRLADTYVVNFSLFQTLPDHWALGSPFPVVPLTRLDEPPTRRATLADISCDSDGRIQSFVGRHDVGPTLPVHDVTPGGRYLLGFFLVGGYQDVLANAHNLFGRMAEAHVRLTGGDAFEIERTVPGQKARRVIENMGYETDELLAALGAEIDEAARLGAGVSDEAASRLRALYAAELVGYTYLE